MKKMLKWFISLFVLLGLIGGTITGVSAGHIDTNNVSYQNIEAKVLNWGTFETIRSTEGTGKPLKCDTEDMIGYIQMDRDSLAEVYDGLAKTDRGKISDIKGCVMEDKVDQYAKWFIYVGMAILVGTLIYMGVKMATKGSDSGDGGMGGMGGGMGGGEGGGGEFFKQIKKPLIGVAILVVVLLGGLNAIVNGLKFFFDLFFR